MSKLYDFLFKPFEILSAFFRRDKAYFGIRSPSVELSKFAIKGAYGFVAAIQEAQVKEMLEVFAPYKIKRTVGAPLYEPLMTIVRDFNYTKIVYEWEI